MTRPTRAAGRAWLPLVLALIVGLALVFGVGAGTARGQEALELTVRNTVVNTDGTTEIVVNVTGSARPDVLDARAFTVREQDEVVEGLTVEPLLEGAGDAATIVVGLVVDVSGSMQGEPLEQTKAAATGLIEDLTARGVPIQLFSFASEANVLSEPTTDGAALVELVDGLVANGETALYDGVTVAAENLAEGGADDAQLNLVVFSDGGDTVSERTVEDAVRVAADAAIPVTLVALETPELDGDAVQLIADGTEGRVVTAADTSELEGAFEQVASDLASQYRLTYRSDVVESETLELAVSVSAGTATQEVSYTVVNDREAPPPPPPTPTLIEPAEASPLTAPAVLIAGGLAAFVAILLLLAYLFSAPRTRADRVLGEQLSRYIEGRDTRSGRSSLVAAHFRDRAMALLDNAPRPRGFDERLSRALEQAAWPLRNNEFLTLIILSALGVGTLAGVVFNPLGGLLLGIVAGAVPVAILSNRRAKRRSAFLSNLPDTLQLLAGSLRAGYGVLQAVDSVAKESSPPTSEEFTRVLTEARLGMPLEEALESMAERVGSDDFRWVVLAINIQREVGGNLAELLDTVAEVLREREMLRRQIKVLSAEGRLSAVILIALPIVLTLYMILVRPEYISALVTSGALGWSMVIGASLLMAVGVLWIRKMIRIEV